MYAHICLWSWGWQQVLCQWRQKWEVGNLTSRNQAIHFIKRFAIGMQFGSLSTADVFNVLCQLYFCFSYSFKQLEIRSMERGICPIALLVLRLTLYSLTWSRVWPLGSRNVIGHVTTGTTVRRFLFVIRWHHVPISHHCRDIKRQK